MAEAVVTEFMDEAALAPLRARCDVLFDPSLVDDRARLLDSVRDCAALIVRNRTQVDGALIDAAPALRVVGRLGVGLDNIDLDAAERRGIEIRPATGANAASVAEYVVATAMILLRGAYCANAAMLSGAWPRAALIGREIGGKRLGLYGFGVIAQATADRARALGMEIAAYDPHVPEDAPAWRGALRLSRDALFETSDVLSVHIPLTQETRGAVNAEALARMKPDAVLINTARGGVVDEAALAAALRAGRLGGAAIDVFAQEPLSESSASVFTDAPNLILTPHVAGVTQEGDVRVSALTVANVMKALFP